MICCSSNTFTFLGSRNKNPNCNPALLQNIFEVVTIDYYFIELLITLKLDVCFVQQKTTNFKYLSQTIQD